MFIYHFSRLIKSKLLWGALALLMVFAFVVADSCSGPSMERSVGVLNGEAVDAKVLTDAGTSVMLLNRIPSNMIRSQAEWQVYASTPYAMRSFSGMVRREQLDDEDADAVAQDRQVWTLMAARAVAERNGLLATPEGAREVLKRLFVGPDGKFSSIYYANFLGALNVGDETIFEKAFASTWLPAQVATQAVYNSTGWVSPMARAFELSMMYDATTAYAVTMANTLQPEAVQVTEADEQAWYDAHTADYEVPEQRVITYLEVPVTAFVEKATVTDSDAVLYYEDHPEEFHGTGTNATEVLPFEEVKDKALAKAKDVRGFEDASIYANTELAILVEEKGLEALKETYGEPKTATVRMDRLSGFQNAADLIGKVFEMNPDFIPYNIVNGTDCIYVVRLDRVIEKHIAPFAEVKDRVRTEAHADRMAKKIQENGETLRGLLMAELAKGATLEQAVANVKVEGLAVSKPVNFVAADNPTLDITHGAKVLDVAQTLATKTLSEPVTVGNEILFVYVAERHPGDPLVKATHAAEVAKEGLPEEAMGITKAWLQWNLDRDPPTDAEGLPLLLEASADEE